MTESEVPKGVALIEDAVTDKRGEVEVHSLESRCGIDKSTDVKSLIGSNRPEGATTESIADVQAEVEALGILAEQSMCSDDMPTDRESKVEV